MLEFLNSPWGGLIGSLVAVAAGSSWVGVKYLPIFNLVKVILNAAKTKQDLLPLATVIYTAALQFGKWLTAYGRKHQGVDNWEKNGEKIVEVIMHNLNAGIQKGLNSDD